MIGEARHSASMSIVTNPAAQSKEQALHDLVHRRQFVARQHSSRTAPSVAVRVLGVYDEETGAPIADVQVTGRRDLRRRTAPLQHEARARDVGGVVARSGRENDSVRLCSRY